MFPDRACSCGAFSLWHPLFPPIAGVFLSLHLCLWLPRLVALAVPTGSSGHGRGPGWVAGRVTSRVGSGPFPSGPRCRLLVSATPELQLPTPPGRDPQLQLGLGLSLAGCGGGGVFNCRSQHSTAGRPWGLPAPGRGLGFPAAPRVQSVADCAPPSGACLERGRGRPLLVPTLSTRLPEIRQQLLLGFPGESSCGRLHAGGS